MQTQNFLTNRTTNERFGNTKKAEDDLNTSSASLYVNRSSRLRNCIGMCCNVSTGELGRPSRTHSIARKDSELVEDAMDTSLMPIRT